MDFPPLEWMEWQSNLINLFIIFHLNLVCTWLKGSIPCQVAEADVTAACCSGESEGPGGTAALAPWPVGGRLVASRASRDNGVATLCVLSAC